MNFQEIYNRAHAAGLAAGAAITPQPMTVMEVDLDDVRIPGTPVYHVAEGLCGFAWVTVKGNTAFGKWAKKNDLARPDYPSGLAFWVHEFNQSVARKEAYAGAFAKVLRENGIVAYSHSRLD